MFLLLMCCVFTSGALLNVLHALLKSQYCPPEQEQNAAWEASKRIYIPYLLGMFFFIYTIVSY